jgi:hypothetical protein
MRKTTTSLTSRSLLRYANPAGLGSPILIMPILPDNMTGHGAPQMITLNYLSRAPLRHFRHIPSRVVMYNHGNRHKHNQRHPKNAGGTCKT